MDEIFKSNRHYDLNTGLTKEFYEKHFENTLEDKDKILLKLGRLFRSIMGAEDPYMEAYKFGKYLICVGEKILPASVVYYVDKFKTLPQPIQDFVICKLDEEPNNYLRNDTGSDKVAWFARKQEYRTRSWQIPIQGNGQSDPDLTVSEHMANKISPIDITKSIELGEQLTQMITDSNPDQISIGTYQELILEGVHNNWKHITPTIRHVLAAIIAKPEIESRSRKRFNDLYRVEHEYLFRNRPYTPDHRQDNPTEKIIDKNQDIVGKDKKITYNTVGDVALNASSKILDLSMIMPLSRDDSNKFSKTEKEEKSPELGAVGTESNKQNEAGGTGLQPTYDSEKHK